MNEKIIRVRKVLQTIKESTEPNEDASDSLILEHWNVVDEMLFDLDNAMSPPYEK